MRANSMDRGEPAHLAPITIASYMFTLRCVGRMIIVTDHSKLPRGRAKIAPILDGLSGMLFAFFASVQTPMWRTGPRPKGRATWPSRPTTAKLLPAQEIHRVEAGGAPGGIKASEQPDQQCHSHPLKNYRGSDLRLKEGA